MTKTLTLRSFDIPAIHKFGIGFDNLFDDLMPVNVPNYLHKGISNRDFRREFKLADHVEISNAHLELGILNVHLKREVPEEAKPKTIAISYKE